MAEEAKKKAVNLEFQKHPVLDGKGGSEIFDYYREVKKRLPEQTKKWWADRWADLDLVSEVVQTIAHFISVEQLSREKQPYDPQSICWGNWTALGQGNYKDEDVKVDMAEMRRVFVKRRFPAFENRIHDNLKPWERTSSEWVSQIGHRALDLWALEKLTIHNRALQSMDLLPLANHNFTLRLANLLPLLPPAEIPPESLHSTLDAYLIRRNQYEEQHAAVPAKKPKKTLKK
ncbi:hypothetical protein HK097_006419 [Rhizophlyctis rosea]|uniref:Uncharacterized protein n=1 Tax=Rhizophlyctis rosea TaxID=64517 RepID=A0AAD5X5Z1_9FUNG|nr:hypothetical protein HK097_006419 [Rhizophlyctis rosea]